MAIPRDAAQRIEEFALAEIAGPFVKRLEADPPPPLIYHYTNKNGLAGILGSGCLWLSDVFCQNDPSELRHGVEHAAELIRMLARRFPDDRALNLFADKFAKSLAGSIEGSAQYYICCFSTQGNRLDQWRAYADNGRGFALGFDTASLEKEFAKQAPGRMTFPVSYNDKMLRQLQEEIFETAIPLVSFPKGKDWPGAVSGEYLGRLAVEMAIKILHVATYFKHEGWREEREYRFLEIVRRNFELDQLKTRRRGDMEVRYREFDWKAVAINSLKEIVIGPGMPGKEGHDHAVEYLNAMGIPPELVKIYASGIPYRP